MKAGWLAVMGARARRHRPPVVVTVHNIILDETSGRAARIMRILERRVFKGADALVAVSPEVGGYVQQHTSRPVRVIRPLGPPPEALRPRDEVRDRLGVTDGQPLVVCVARLHPQKGLSTLVEASSLLRTSGIDLRVAIVGEGPLAGELTDQIRARGLEGTVLLAGPSDNAPDELAAADVVVIPSVWESGPLVLAESLVLSRPVVATPVGLVPEVIREGVSGRIVPIGDARALAAAVAALLADPVAARAHGRGRPRRRRRGVGCGCAGRGHGGAVPGPARAVMTRPRVLPSAASWLPRRSSSPRPRPARPRPVASPPGPRSPRGRS